MNHSLIQKVSAMLHAPPKAPQMTTNVPSSAAGIFSRQQKERQPKSLENSASQLLHACANARAVKDIATRIEFATIPVNSPRENPHAKSAIYAPPRRRGSPALSCPRFALSIYSTRASKRASISYRIVTLPPPELFSPPSSIIAYVFYI